MGWWKHVVEARTRDWTFSPVGAAGTAVDPESVYLSVFLDSMRVVHVRKGLQRFYGTVSSYCALPHRSNGTAEFFVVNTPTHLKDASPAELARVLNLKTRLLGPVPYRGGDLQLQVGLFSISAGDLSGPYLEVLESLATVAGVSLIGPALALVAPLRKGLELLVGAEDPSVLEVGLSTTFAPPTTGTYCLVGAAPGHLDPSDLGLDPNAQLLVAGHPVRDVPYLVLTVSASPRRDDWFQIPTLRDAHADLVRDVASGSQARVREALGVFRRAAVLSPDLLSRDGARLADQVTEEVMLAMGTRANSSGATTLRSLEAVPLYAEQP